MAQTLSRSDGIRCMLMRGGTSKGAYFLADDLPRDAAERDDLLLRVMGTPGSAPDRRARRRASPDQQGRDRLAVEPATPTSTICSSRWGRRARSSATRRPAATSSPASARSRSSAASSPARGLGTTVRIRLVNTGRIATATFPTPGGRPGLRRRPRDRRRAGHGRAIRLDFGARPVRTALFPTGRVVDEIDGHARHVVDNGMPAVLLRADEFGVHGAESPGGARSGRRAARAVERVRIGAGRLMGLGDVAGQTVPKMFLLSPARKGGRHRHARVHSPARAHLHRRADGRVGGRGGAHSRGRRIRPRAPARGTSRSRSSIPAAPSSSRVSASSRTTTARGAAGPHPSAPPARSSTARSSRARG